MTTKAQKSLFWLNIDLIKDDATRVDAIASRVAAIATRVEAIATRVGAIALIKDNGVVSSTRIPAVEESTHVLHGQHLPKLS